MMLSYVSICPAGPIYHWRRLFAAPAINTRILCQMLPGMEDIVIVSRNIHLSAKYKEY